MYSIKSRLVMGEMVLPTWISTSRDLGNVLMDKGVEKGDIYWQALPVVGSIPQKARAEIPFVTTDSGVFVEIKRLGNVQFWLNGPRLILDTENLKQMGVMLDSRCGMLASTADWQIEVKILDIVSASLSAHCFHTKPTILGHPSNCFIAKLIKS